MSEKKHELYLIAFALVSAAVLILYIAFDSPPINAIKVPPKSSTTQAEEQPDATESTQTATAGDETSAEQEGTSFSPSAQSSTVKTAGLVNINTATKEQLMTLDGIGEIKAQAILDYRRENGDFYTIDELTEVTGIGEKTLEKIRAQITV